MNIIFKQNSYINNTFCGMSDIKYFHLIYSNHDPERHKKNQLSQKELTRLIKQKTAQLLNQNYIDSPTSGFTLVSFFL